VVQRTLTSSFVEALLDGMMASITLVLMLLYSPKLSVISIGALALYLGGRMMWYKPLHSATEEQILNSAKQSSHSRLYAGFVR
jgi:ATP-binding cassette subfamily B protein RaxB